MSAPLDVLAIGPHPDDVEIGVGGTLHKLTARGLQTGILDLTRGEAGTRGTPEERQREAQAAAEILGVAVRVNANLPDGRVANTQDQRMALIPVLRKYRPRILLAPMDNDRHVDHNAAHDLVRDAAYLAGLQSLDTGDAPHRPDLIYFYRVYGDPTTPQLIVNITNHFEAKTSAMASYKSQLYNPEYEARETYVSSQVFWQGIESRARFWGAQIHAEFGEPLYTLGPVGVDIPPGLEAVS